MLVNAKAKLDLGITDSVEAELAKKLSGLTSKMYASGAKLTEVIAGAHACEDMKAEATYYHDVVIAEMNELRAYADAAEEIIGEEYMPYTTYGKLLYGVND